MRHVRLMTRLLSIPLLTLTIFVLGTEPMPADARGGSRGGGGAQPAAVNPAMGAQLFDQCVQWVSMNGTGIQNTNDFYIDLIAELDLDTAQHRGPMRIWWQSPDKFRQELTEGRRVTTKVLSGDHMWIGSAGSWKRMHGTAGGVRAIRQLKEDRDRLGDLAQFLTLRSLKGPDVRFTFVAQTRGTGTYKGEWLKITRSAPGGATIHFWLAYTRTANGQLRATYPGIVRIDGDAARNLPDETYILRNWIKPRRGAPRTMRYPTSIEAYSSTKGRAPLRFLRAQVRDIKINSGIDASRFRPAQRAAAQPARRQAPRNR